MKNKSMVEQAKEIFGDDVKVTCEGQRHVGAALGTKDFKQKVVSAKVEEWVEDVRQLATVAVEEPQAALCAFNTAMAHRWVFLQRTVGEISSLFQPLEDEIRNNLIPSMCGRQVSDMERRMLALPYRHGGLGIRNPVVVCEEEYRSSQEITKPLVDLIVRQEVEIRELDEE